MQIKDKLDTLKKEALEKISTAAELTKLDQVRIAYLGKKGPITEILRGMKDLSAEERPVVGSIANEIRDAIAVAIEDRKSVLEMENLSVWAIKSLRGLK